MSPFLKKLSTKKEHYSNFGTFEVAIISSRTLFKEIRYLDLGKIDMLVYIS